MLLGYDLGEPLLELPAGGGLAGEGFEGVLELAAGARQFVGGQGVHGKRRRERDVQRGSFGWRGWWRCPAGLRVAGS